MDFTTAQSEVATQLGLDINDTATATNIKRWLNMSYQDIVGAHTWSWLQDITTVTMATDYTTGTVSATAASSTITFSSGPTDSQANRYIQFSSADDWYKITAHTAGATTATISPAYIQTSNLSSGTFTIRTFYYSFPSTVDRIYYARQANSPSPVGIIDASKYDYADPFSTSTGEVKAIIIWGNDSTGYQTFTPYPFPDSVGLIEFRYFKKITELSASSDTPLFPARINSLWIEGALGRGLRFLDDDRSERVLSRFDDKIKDLINKDNTGLSKEYHLQSVDSRPSRATYIQMPPEFGKMYE